MEAPKSEIFSGKPVGKLNHLHVYMHVYAFRVEVTVVHVLLSQICIYICIYILYIYYIYIYYISSRKQLYLVVGLLAPCKKVKHIESSKKQLPNKSHYQHKKELSVVHMKFLSDRGD